MRAWLVLVAIVVGGVGCAARLPPQPAVHPTSVGWRDAVDWEAAGDEAVEMLAEYLKVDTINAPGNEGRGARYLAALLARDGIETELVGHQKGREGLIARLPAPGATEPPLCLLSHIDVVPAEDEVWPEGYGPLSGAIDEEGMLWGRGALDMKSLGIAQLHAMALIRRLGVPLRREVVLLAVADEEVDNEGMQHLVRTRWDALGCGHVINEGGFGVRGALFDEQVVHGISVGEKGVLWLDMVATGEPGHGSTPLGDSALDRLRAAMDAIDARKVTPNWHPMMLELLARAGADGGGLTGFVLRRRGLVKSLAKGAIRDNPLTWASITTTVHLTGLDGAVAPNVLPGQVRATYDIRLQPGVTREQVVARLTELTDHIDGISFEVRHHFPAAVSPYEDDPVYEAIVAHTLDGRADHVAGPLLSVGFTDSVFARQRGTIAYGYAPFVVEPELLTGMHGHRERIPVDQVREGSRRFFGMLVQAAADLEVAPTQPDDPPVRLVPSSADVLARSAPETRPPEPPADDPADRPDAPQTSPTP